MTRPVGRAQTSNRQICIAEKSRKTFQIWTNPHRFKSYHFAAVFQSLIKIFLSLIKFISSIPHGCYGYNNTIKNLLWCIFCIKNWFWTMNSDFKFLDLLFLCVSDPLELADSMWWQDKTEQCLNSLFGNVWLRFLPVKDIFLFLLSWILQQAVITKCDLHSASNK